jgi:hypothetical protein
VQLGVVILLCLFEQYISIGGYHGELNKLLLCWMNISAYIYMLSGDHLA